MQIAYAAEVRVELEQYLFGKISPLLGGAACEYGSALVKVNIGNVRLDLVNYTRSVMDRVAAVPDVHHGSVMWENLEVAGA